MSSAANHRKRSHRSENRQNYRRIAPVIAPDLKPGMGIAALLRNHLSIKRIATNNAAKVRPDTPHAAE